MNEETESSDRRVTHKGLAKFKNIQNRIMNSLCSWSTSEISNSDFQNSERNLIDTFRINSIFNLEVNIYVFANYKTAETIKCMFHPNAPLSTSLVSFRLLARISCCTKSSKMPVVKFWLLIGIHLKCDSYINSFNKLNLLLF